MGEQNSTYLITFNNADKLKRCTRLLRQIVYAAPQQTFDEDTSPSHFRDEEVQKVVESLNLNYGQSPQSKSVTKKRKVVSSDSNPISSLFRAIYETLDVAWTGDEAELMPEALFL